MAVAAAVTAEASLLAGVAVAKIGEIADDTVTPFTGWTVIVRLMGDGGHPLATQRRSRGRRSPRLGSSTRQLKWLTHPGPRAGEVVADG